MLDIAVVGGDLERSIVLLDEVNDAGRSPLLDAALGPALLQRVAAGGPESLRAYRPRATLAFSGRDCASPAIGLAAAAAQAAGFEPVRRGPGGRAAAYHQQALCLDHVGPAHSSGEDPLQIRPRFEAFGALLAGALRSLGVDAQVGPVPGEYCPGEFSINDGRGHKLVGTAQRLVRGGWLFGTVILVADAEPVRDVLIGVYDALGLDWDPGTVGAVDGSVPGVSVDDVKAAVFDAYARLGELRPARTSAEVVDLAHSRIDRQRVPGLSA